MIWMYIYIIHNLSLQISMENWLVERVQHRVIIIGGGCDHWSVRGRADDQEPDLL